MYVARLSGWYRPGAVKRAFQLAASGDCRSIANIQRRLCFEQYDDVFDHLAGQLIRQQLNGPNRKEPTVAKQKKPEQMQKQQQGQQPKRRQQGEQPEGQLQQERESGEQQAFVRVEDR